MSIGVVVEQRGLERALAAIDRLANLPTSDLMDVAGATVESQTRRRIEEEKTAPSGAAWPANREGTSILLRTGRHLRDSIGYTASAAEAAVGAAWEFADVHQSGRTIRPKSASRLRFSLGGREVFARQVTIPARPFVGLSAANEQELVDVVSDWVEAVLP